MKNNLDINTASAVLTAGPAGSEAHTGAPVSLEFFILNHKPGDDVDVVCQDHSNPETVGHHLVQQLMAAFAIAEDGHVHVGLIHPEALPFTEPLFTACAEIGVTYYFGSAAIHPLGAGSSPVITAREDRTHWEVVQEPPAKIRLVSLYVLRDGHLSRVCTKPARGYCDKEAHTN